ncbi:hypothetical protein JDV02_002518 [Purpureocillium takamizusanense]|uniref:Uncharacterized protein n=1 Tax=Purpureocillium takamizusanense TaxID=2060973 RepID=A0A9Q8QBZ3_9HYPO|nr:uncharacterized protein JDV02_002518 [Purpureocillium takamizusanense]UNI16042.1 hypothetical protein JDV02_002518 [Purpureocillium takamizusanense]
MDLFTLQAKAALDEQRPPLSQIPTHVPVRAARSPSRQAPALPLFCTGRGASSLAARRRATTTTTTTTRDPSQQLSRESHQQRHTDGSAASAYGRAGLSNACLLACLSTKLDLCPVTESSPIQLVRPR